MRDFDMTASDGKASARRTSPLWVGGLVLLGLFYIAAGANHFVHPGMYVAIMPPYIPWPVAMVYLTGAAEILGGLGVLVPDGMVFKRTRAAAAWGLVAMLIGFLAVHVNMCLHPEAFPQIPVWLIWARLPLQAPLIAWAWWYTRERRV